MHLFGHVAPPPMLPVASPSPSSRDARTRLFTWRCTALNPGHILQPAVEWLSGRIKDLRPSDKIHQIPSVKDFPPELYQGHVLPVVSRDVGLGNNLSRCCVKCQELFQASRAERVKAVFMFYADIQEDQDLTIGVNGALTEPVNSVRMRRSFFLGLSPETPQLELLLGAFCSHAAQCVSVIWFGSERGLRQHFRPDAGEDVEVTPRPDSVPRLDRYGGFVCSAGVQNENIGRTSLKVEPITSPDSNTNPDCSGISLKWTEKGFELHRGPDPETQLPMTE
ncbi:hypothetical protein Q8A73_018100 [Channa argus]|nr:hypothetical protein Q8A73_018100 [Channa argus]